MASPLGHSLIGVALYLATVRSSEWSRRWGWLFLLVLFSTMADIDYFPALLGDIDLANAFHRGLTHTALFAFGIVVLYLITGGIKKHEFLWKPALVLLAASLIHLVLDVVAEDGKAPFGIPVFYPFSNSYYYGPWIIFPKIHKGSYAELFSSANVRVALFEILFFTVLILIAGAGRLIFDRYARRHA